MKISDLNKSSENHLLNLIKDGNQLAFRQVYDMYWDRLYIYTYNILNDQWLTEDVLHEVFTNIWIRRKKAEIKNLKSYLFNSVRNRALIKIRDDKFTELDEYIIEKLSISPEIEKQFDSNELKRTIENAIKDLPSRCKTIFQMSKFQDYSNSEIASHFNISNRTVENQISLALKHLRNKLGNFMFFLFF